MRSILALVVFSFLALPAMAMDWLTTPYWEIAGPKDRHTWVEIMNYSDLKEATEPAKVLHISIISRKKGAPVWDIRWERDHIAITPEALRRSVVGPFKTKSVKPERFYWAFVEWEKAEKEGKAPVCTTSLHEYLTSQGKK